MKGKSFTLGDRSQQKEKISDMEDVMIIGSNKPCKTCREIKVKTEILDEIENFSGNDELDIELCIKNESLKDVLQHENSESDCQRDTSIRFLRRQINRISLSNGTEFKGHLGHDYGKLPPCRFCNEQFSKDDLHTNFTAKSLACRQCELQFQAKSIPKKCKRSVVRKTYECSICKKKLLHHQSLRDHKLLHNNVRPHQCIICGKSFLRPSSLKTHMIVHTAESPYACDLCPAKFKRSSVLKTHKLTHTGVRRFECDICKNRFHLKGALKHHILAHYGIRPYKCKDCGKTYRRSWGLKVHTYRHTGVKRFECDYCKLRFSVKTKLANHIYTHTGEKPYKCDICERQYGERYQLKAHRCMRLPSNLLRVKSKQILFFQPKISRNMVKVN